MTHHSLTLLLLAACADPAYEHCPLTLLEYDAYADGTVDDRTAYSYDAEGNLRTEDYDARADGTVQRRIVYTYGVNGNLREEDVDNFADGTIEERRTYTYDEDGNVNSLTDAVDNETTWVLDSEGRVVEESIVINQQTLTRQYVYDENGRLWIHIDRNDRAIEYLYNAEGLVEFEKWYAEGNDPRDEPAPTPVRVIEYSYTYDPAGHLTGFSVNDTDVDLAYTYDAAGYLTGTSWDFAGLADPNDVTLAYTYLRGDLKSVTATIDDVVRAPSRFSKTFGCPPSMMDMHEFVVPRSIPRIFAIEILLFVYDHLPRPHDLRSHLPPPCDDFDNRVRRDLLVRSLADRVVQVRVEQIADFAERFDSHLEEHLVELGLDELRLFLDGVGERRVGGLDPARDGVDFIQRDDERSPVFAEDFERFYCLGLDSLVDVDDKDGDGSTTPQFGCDDPYFDAYENVRKLYVEVR